MEVAAVRFSKDPSDANRASAIQVLETVLATGPKPGEGSALRPVFEGVRNIRDHIASCKTN